MLVADTAMRFFFQLRNQPPGAQLGILQGNGDNPLCSFGWDL